MAELATHFLPTNDQKTFAVDIDGYITAQDADAIIDEVAPRMELGNKMRVLVRIRHLKGIDPRIFLQKRYYSLKFEGLGRTEKYAMVGGPKWIHALVRALSHVFKQIQMKTFSLSEEAQAWDWLKA